MPQYLYKDALTIPPACVHTSVWARMLVRGYNMVLLPSGSSPVELYFTTVARILIVLIIKTQSRLLLVGES